jgi:hypothetical protein
MLSEPASAAHRSPSPTSKGPSKNQAERAEVGTLPVARIIGHPCGMSSNSPLACTGSGICHLRIIRREPQRNRFYLFPTPAVGER